MLLALSETTVCLCRHNVSRSMLPRVPRAIDTRAGGGPAGGEIILDADDVSGAGIGVMNADILTGVGRITLRGHSTFTEARRRPA